MTIPIEQGFGAMGKPIPPARRQSAYDAAREMGLSHGDAMSCVNATADLLERDRPFEAMGAAMKYVDLTGSYRLFAHLLTWPAEKMA